MLVVCQPGRLQRQPTQLHHPAVESLARVVELCVAAVAEGEDAEAEAGQGVGREGLAQEEAPELEGKQFYRFLENLRY